MKTIIIFFTKKYLKKTLNEILSDLKEKQKLENGVNKIKYYNSKIQAVSKFLDNLLVSIVDGELTDSEINEIKTNAEKLIQEIKL